MTDLQGTTEEIWKDAVGYPIYKISNLGRIGNFRPNREHILKPCLSRCGYRVFTYWGFGKPKVLFIHKLVAQAFIPNPENKKQVNHINGIKSDNRIENLEWCTASENQQHAYNTGLKKTMKRADNGNSVLTEKDVSEIRYLIEKQMPGRQIARKFKVSKFAIYAIKIGKTWKDIKPNSSNLQPSPY